MKMADFLLLPFLLSPLLLPPTWGCETGIAHVGSVLSVPRSLMANADVAYLKTFDAPTVKRCMEDCCTGKYGSCTVASFKTNVTEKNCMHFYCEPLTKCKFLSSRSTDSFSFSTSKPPSTTQHSISRGGSPSTSSATTLESGSSSNATSQQIPAAKEEIATYSEEQVDLKNDNTSIKPRKGVEDVAPDVMPSKSSVKPRKGVTLEDVPPSMYLQKGDAKSNVKPRKGVENYDDTIAPSSSSVIGQHPLSTSLYQNSNGSVTADDVVMALQKVFEDDAAVASTSADAAVVTSSTEYPTIAPTPSTGVHVTSSAEGDAHSTHSNSSPSHTLDTATVRSSRVDITSTSSASSTPVMATSSSGHGSSGKFTTSTIVSSSTTYYLTLLKTDRPRLEVGPEWTRVTQASPVDTPESSTWDDVISSREESEKKYKSSIHLIMSLVFGLLVLFAVLGVVAKRIYDSWLRRDYHRMNYLIDGIYNGVE